MKIVQDLSPNSKILGIHINAGAFMIPLAWFSRSPFNPNFNKFNDSLVWLINTMAPFPSLLMARNISSNFLFRIIGQGSKNIIINKC